MFFLLFVAGSFWIGASAANYAVIGVGSKGYSNYRHQAGGCRAYQVLKSRGVPAENIIVLMYDDVANSSRNRFPGKMFNEPDLEGSGKDVYSDCQVDYRGDQVTPETWTSVLKGTGSGKVLKSTSNDNVFIYYIDNGAPGLISFPSDAFHQQEMKKTLQQMSDAKMFNKLVFYLDSGYSGSMFQDLSIPGVYAVSAASPTESSWAMYCGRDSKVAGVTLNTCLGDLFSISWMEALETSSSAGDQTLQAQFEMLVAKSGQAGSDEGTQTVMQWGDLSFTTDRIADFMGHGEDGISSNPPKSSSIRPVFDPSQKRPWTSYKSTEADVRSLSDAYDNAETGQERLADGEKLMATLQQQMHVERVYRRFVEIAYPENAQAQARARNRKAPSTGKHCELKGHRALLKYCGHKIDGNSAFALEFHQFVVNVCYDVWMYGLNLSVLGAMEVACRDVVEDTQEVKV